MVKGGQQKQQTRHTYTTKAGETKDFAKYILTNQHISEICNDEPLTEFIYRQQKNWIAHCARANEDTYIKKLTFADYFKHEKKMRVRMMNGMGMG